MEGDIGLILRRIFRNLELLNQRLELFKSFGKKHWLVLDTRRSLSLSLNQSANCAMCRPETEINAKNLSFCTTVVLMLSEVKK